MIFVLLSVCLLSRAQAYTKIDTLSLHDALPIWGGAGFPFGKKMRAVAKASIRRGVRPVVVINGSEGEPACRKDTDRKSTRLNSSHGYISYAVFCLQKKSI